jgi:hypothetical protein
LRRAAKALTTSHETQVDGAVELDSSTLSFQQAVEAIVDIIARHMED